MTPYGWPLAIWPDQSQARLKSPSRPSANEIVNSLAFMASITLPESFEIVDFQHLSAMDIEPAMSAGQAAWKAGDIRLPHHTVAYIWRYHDIDDGREMIHAALLFDSFERLSAAKSSAITGLRRMSVTRESVSGVVGICGGAAPSDDGWLIKAMDCQVKHGDDLITGGDITVGEFVISLMCPLTHIFCRRATGKRRDEPSEQLQRRAAQRGRPPLHRVTYVDITGWRAEVSRGTGTHASPVPHSVAGHVRQLTDCRTTWVKPHLRGFENADDLFPPRSSYLVRKS